MIKVIHCDCCGTERRVADTASGKLPKGWHGISDFYGNETHCCDNLNCMKWLTEFSTNYWFEALRDATPDRLRAASDAELETVRRLACLAAGEAILRVAQEEAERGTP